MANGSKLTHVRPGDPLEIGAGTFNAMVDAAKAHRGSRHGLGRKMQPEANGSNFVLVRNDTTFQVERFYVLGLNSIIFAPSTDEDEFLRQPVFSGVQPVPGTHDDNFVIVQEPIAVGAYGVAMLTGISPVRIWVDGPTGNSMYRYAEISTTMATLYKAPQGPAKVLHIEGGEQGNKWAIVQLGQRTPVTWAKALDDWTNAAGNGSYVDCYPCDDKDGTTVNTVSSIKVWLPRNGQTKDPNIRQDAIIPVRLAEDGNYVCVGDYLDEPIGAWKIWHSTTIPAGWQLATAFGGRFLVGYDAADADHDTVGETGGADTHTHAGHDNHANHSDHPDHSTHPAHTFDGARQYGEGYPGFDMISNVSHDAHSSHGSHGAHSAHTAHDTVSNKPKYKTVVMIERVD